MVGRGTVRVLQDAADLALAAAEEVVERAEAAIRHHGRFDLVLAGGSTPRRLYALLADGASRYRARMPWERTRIFFGDERHVPPDHPDSNYRMAADAMLAHVPVSPANVYRIAGEDPDAVAAARHYEEALRAAFRLPEGGVPRFDLVLLGLGTDGHTASLFPGTDALAARGRLVVASFVPRLAAWRMTLTLPVLDAAAAVLFLVYGADKAQALKAAVAGPADPGAPPSRLVAPRDGDLLWLVDREAASDLPASRA